MTAEIQHRLKQNKSSLLSLLRPTAEPELYGLTLGGLEEIAGAEWPEVRDDPKQLQALAHMAATRRLRERGEVPQHYATITVCAGCGPVWLWPGAPEPIDGVTTELAVWMEQSQLEVIGKGTGIVGAACL